MTTYEEFLETKIPKPEVSGFDPVLPLLPALFDWQKLLVGWAIKRGRAALFEDCGLGKTIESIEWARQVVAKTGKPVLILAPLTVCPQTVEEGAKFGIEVKHVRHGEEIAEPAIYITNYEKLELFLEAIPRISGV